MSAHAIEDETPKAASAAKAVRYVELVRVSTKGQADSNTPENQRAALARLAKVRPGECVARIDENGVSGAMSLDARVTLKRLFDLLALRKVDEVRVYALDRLTRTENPVERATIFRAIQEAGARIVTSDGRVLDPSAEGDTGSFVELQYTIEAWGASQERARIVRRTMDGRRRLAAAGQFTGLGRLPFWLTWDREAKKVVLVDKGVEIVRQARDLVLEGLSLRVVSERLTASGALTPRVAGRWSLSTVRRFLSSRALVGEFVQSSGKDKYPLAVPAVMTEDEFAKVQRALDLRAGKRTRTSYSADALCRGKALCGICGANMNVQNVRGRRPGSKFVYYRCKSQNACNDLEPCGNRYHPVFDVDAAVWERVVAIAQDPETRRRAIESCADPSGDDDEIARLEAALAKNEQALLQLKRELHADEITESVYKKFLSELAVKRREAAARLAGLHERRASNAATRRAMVSLDEQMTALAANIDSADFAKRREIIEALVPDDGEHGVSIYLEGIVEVRGAFDVSSAEGSGGELLSMSARGFSRSPTATTITPESTTRTGFTPPSSSISTSSWPNAAMPCAAAGRTSGPPSR